MPAHVAEGADQPGPASMGIEPLIPRSSWTASSIALRGAEGSRLVSERGEGTADTDPSSTFMRQVMAAAAQHEREIIRARTRGALAVMKREGKRGGKIPYGFRLAADGVHLEPEPFEQEVIDQMRSWRREGASLRIILRRLERSVYAPEGRDGTLRRFSGSSRGGRLPSGDLMERTATYPTLTHTDQAQADAFQALIDDPNTSEHQLHQFLERDPRFLRFDFLRGHQLHDQSVITKLQISTALISDFVYLTKDSDHWTVVLVEIERASKKLLKNEPHYPGFADLTQALAQVRDWVEFLRTQNADLLARLRPYRTPLAANPVDLKAILVIGRDSAIPAGDAARRAWRGLSGPEVKVLTYDSLLHHFKSVGHGDTKPNVLTMVRDKFAYKYMHHLPFNSLAFMGPGELELTGQQQTELRADGYDIQAWLAGQLLKVNGRQVTVAAP